MKKPPECSLVIGALINVWNPQLRLPQEGVIGAFENLALFCDRTDDRLQGGAPIDIAKGTSLDFLDNLGNASPDRSEIL